LLGEAGLSPIGHWPLVPGRLRSVPRPFPPFCRRRQSVARLRSFFFRVSDILFWRTSWRNVLCEHFPSGRLREIALLVFLFGSPFASGGEIPWTFSRPRFGIGVLSSFGTYTFFAAICDLFVSIVFTDAKSFPSQPRDGVSFYSSLAGGNVRPILFQSFPRF